MKKRLFSLFICMLLLSGCIYQRELRPLPKNEEVWICEEPYSELHWDKESLWKIVWEETPYEFVFSTSSGPIMKIYDKMEYVDEDTVKYGNCLFTGHTTYRDKTATVEIIEDFKNIFNGELPILEFKRYNKKEYLENTKK